MAAKVQWYKNAWYVRTHHNRKRHDRRVGPSKDDQKLAEKIARKINAQLVLGRFSLADRSRTPTIPFREFAESWLRREIEIPLERLIGGHVAAGTARSYRVQVDVHLSPYLGSQDVRKLGLREVQAFYDHCIDTGHPRSAKSIEMALNVFRLVLRHAIGQGIVEWNAVEQWKRSRPRRRSSAAAPIEASKVFSADELSVLLDVTRRDSVLHYPLVLFLADTGARIGEAAALLWDDVNLEAGTARIWRSFSSDTALGPTKTGRERVVELSMRLVRALAEAQPPVFPIPEGSLVFAAQHGGFLRAANFRERVFKKLVFETLGAGRHLSPHNLRHTWASLHMARGTPLKRIQQQGGWTTAKVLLDTYGHFMPSESRGYADVIGGENGSQTAPDGNEDLATWATDVQPGAATQDSDRSSSGTNPRSPIMHFTLRHPAWGTPTHATIKGEAGEGVGREAARAT